MTIKRRKLLLNERVEVRQFEEGLRGSWHPGVVVNVSKFCRSVKYDELLSETGDSNLIESIIVTKPIEGIQCRRQVPSAYRGHIRPLPPSSDTCEKFSFGVCVDAMFEDAWWEGVVLDCHNDSNERLVFFPDEGDEKNFSISQLRITRDWDELSGIWCDRGVWMLVQLAMGLEGDVSSCIKNLWFYLQLNDGFKKLVSDWTCGVQDVWRTYVMDAANETALVLNINPYLSAVTDKKGNKRNDSNCALTTVSSQNKQEKDSTLECSRKRSLIIKFRSKKAILNMDVCTKPTQDRQVDHTRSLKDREGGDNLRSHVWGGRNLNKPGRITLNLLECSQKLREDRSLHVNLNKHERCSSTKKKVSKQFQQTNSNFKPESKAKEKVLHAKAIKKHARNVRPKSTISHPGKRKRKRKHSSCLSDTICSFCNYGGDLILCDACLSSYHLGCLERKDVPLGNWLCPSCCCGLCGKGDPSRFTNACLQCGRAYHVSCLTKDECLLFMEYPSEHFCTKACYELCAQLHQLLGISNPTSVGGLTWTLIRSSKNVYNFPGIQRNITCIKLPQVLRVMHECFIPIKEPHTKKDMIKDLIFNSESKLKRLNFHGFYAFVLHRGVQIVSVATVRFYGLKVAEMPLVATPFKFRRQGMCRLLMQELLKLLAKFGVERLILPAVAQLRKMWETSFGFSEMPLSERQQLSGYPFVGFQGTMILQRLLRSSEIYVDNIGTSQDLEGNSSSLFLERNYLPNDESRFSGLFYEHKENGKIIGKENMVNSCNEETKMFVHVYKRRRVLSQWD